MRKSPRPPRARRAPLSQQKTVVETLEARRLLAASVSLAVDGTLTLRGADDVYNKFAISLQSNGTSVVASIGGKVKGLGKASIKAIRIEGSGARDDVWISPGITAPAVINTHGGADSVFAGGGNDTIDGGDGNDTLNGQTGHDKIVGGFGNDTVRAGSGNDTIVAGDGADSVDGESGNDSTLGDAGNDKLIGGDGADSLSGGTGSDRVSGLNGNDTLLGDAGLDSLFGGFGNDRIVGGADADVIDGGPDTDTVYQDAAPGTDDGDGDDDDGGSAPPPPPPTTGVENTYDQWSTYTGTAGSSAPVVVLKLLGKVITAGGTVHGNANATTLSVGTPLTARYEWNFGDAGGAFNTLRGWNAAHNYEAAGTYTVKLTVTDELGRASTVSTTVTVKPDARRTVYVSETGSDANSGTSADRPVRTVQRASALLTDNTRVLFNRGDRFDVGTAFLDVNDRNVYVGAYGSGADPLLRKVASSNDTVISVWISARDVVIEGITFDSVYLPVGNSAPHIKVTSVYAGGVNVTVRGCTFLNVDTAVNANRLPTGLLVQDNDAPSMTGIRGYLVWGEGADHAYLGNRAVNSTREHIFRMDGVSRLLVAHNDVRNASRSGVDAGDYSKGSIEVHKGSWAYVARNKVVDGTIRVGPRGGSIDPAAASHEWSVVEANESRDVSYQLRPGAHKVMLRNNVVWQDDSDDGIKIYARDPQGRAVRDVWILNNTGYNTNDHGRFLAVESGVTGVTVANNLYVMPNMYTGGDRTGSVVVYTNDLSAFRSFSNNVWQTPARILPWAQGGVNYVGAAWADWGYRTGAEWEAFAQVNGDRFARVTLNGWTPTTGGAADGAARKVAGVWDDLYGRPRSTTGVTAGAVQV